MEVKDIKKIACVGAGTIGHSWALLFAQKGYSVYLYDIKNEVVQSALDRIKSGLQTLVEVEVITKEEADTAFGRIKGTATLAEAVKEADFVQESSLELLDVKKKVFKDISELCPEHTILASSSSGISMTEISEETKGPERCIVSHPFNPPHIIPLVELVPGDKTSEETIETARDFYTKLGKKTVVVRKFVTGYLANRLQTALVREAIDLVNEGVASVKDIDIAVSSGPGLRWALMGPFLIWHLADLHDGLGGLLRKSEYLYNPLATWPEFPPGAVKKCVEGVKSELGKATVDEVVKWRDKKLIKLLRLLEYM